MTRDEALQLLEAMRQMPDDIPDIDQLEVAEWIVALSDPDDRLIERKLFDLRRKRRDSRIARLIAGLGEDVGDQPSARQTT